MSTDLNSKEPAILFEDSDVAVIAKPSGVVVTTAASVPKGSTVQEWWWARLQSLEKSKDEATQVQDWSSLLPADFTQEWGSPD